MIGLCVGMALACTVAIVFGRTRPHLNVASALGLQLCENRTCFWGIVPGRTSWADAKTLYKDSPEVKIRLSEGEIVLLPDQRRKTVAAIMINPSPGHQITAGEIISLYGAPLCVEIGRFSGKLILRYDTLDVTLKFADNDFSPDIPVRALAIWDMTWRLDTHDDPCRLSLTYLSIHEGEVVLRTWHGFASVQHYLAGQ
jgi:hypothetical protein